MRYNINQQYDDYDRHGKVTPPPVIPPPVIPPPVTPPPVTPPPVTPPPVTPPPVTPPPVTPPPVTPPPVTPPPVMPPPVIPELPECPPVQFNVMPYQMVCPMGVTCTPHYHVPIHHCPLCSHMHGHYNWMMLR